MAVEVAARPLAMASRAMLGARSPPIQSRDPGDNRDQQGNGGKFHHHFTPGVPSNFFSRLSQQSM